MQASKSKKQNKGLKINKWVWMGVGIIFVAAASVAGYVVWRGEGSFVEGFGGNETRLFSVEQDGAFGYIDETGSVVIAPQFEEAAHHFSEGFAPVLVDGKWGFVNAEGELAIAPQYDIVTPFSEGIAGVVRGSQASYIDPSGTVIYNLAPEQGDSFGEFVDGLAPVRLGDRWGFIDTSGQFAINPQFDQVGVFSEELAMVVVGGRAGYVDRSGDIVITPQYEDASRFSNGIAPIRENGRWGFINKSGEVVIDPQFSGLQMTVESYGWVGFGDGLTAVLSDDGQWGFIDKSGDMIIEPQFEAVSGFADELAAVRLGDRWGYIDQEGRIIINPQYDSARDFENGLAFVEGPTSGYINTDGQFVWSETNPDYVSPQTLAAQTGAATRTSAINRAQQAYYLENGRFTSQLEQLGLGSAEETGGYRYEITLIGLDRVKVTAIPTEEGLKSYLGYVAIAAINGTNTSVATVCQSNNPSQTALYPPQLVDSAFQCAPGSAKPHES